ncbi:unnamed protein product [Paramecium pentaurelia]|uniref:Uncharacterized protein n=1 Tax=Paramecium pentaurelia TaxID=43138 RepID=A0A8S1SZW0_9CILI|nr:unnamed protein product [Paramecium pentaurelia]
MLNLKKHSEQDVDSLIESMLRLIEYMNNNPAIKRQIFQSFNQEDLEKILNNLNEKKNIFLRKVSCIFLCIVLQNEDNCQNFMKFCDLLPINSKLALNGIPEQLSQYISSDLLLKLNQAQPSENSLCWFYTLQMAKEKIPNLAYFQLNSKELKKQINDFVDPSECMIGIIYRKSPSKTPQTETQNWSNRNEHNHKMSISPVSKQMASLILPLKEINNPKYYQKYVAKSFNQQQCKNLLSNTARTENSQEKHKTRLEIFKNKFQ